MEIIIRAGEPSDAQDLKEIYAAPDLYSATLQLPYPSLALWESRTQPSGDTGVRLVAEANGKVVGDIFLRKSPIARTAHVLSFGMGVHADYQGHGIGYRLLEEAISFGFKWLNAQRIELKVYVDNTPAIRLYKKVGFVTAGVKKKGSLPQWRICDRNRLVFY